MPNIVLTTKAAPLYSFLSHINPRPVLTGSVPQKKILDCGAGGSLPPLSLFSQYGFETWGIDTADEPLRKAETFNAQHDLKINFSKGDMRRIPFEDETFDYVYEHYSMCHLSKKDTTQAVCEMRRVLKKGGLCFLGVISADSWPKAAWGHAEEAGEYWMEEGGERTLHSMFADEEADQLVSDWEIVSKEKRIVYMRQEAANVSESDWMALYPEAQGKDTEETWTAQYVQRANRFQYVHLYYFLEKKT